MSQYFASPIELDSHDSLCDPYSTSLLLCGFVLFFLRLRARAFKLHHIFPLMEIPSLSNGCFGGLFHARGCWLYPVVAYTGLRFVFFPVFVSVIILPLLEPGSRSFVLPVRSFSFTLYIGIEYIGNFPIT
jgi:hypothetical protein